MRAMRVVFFERGSKCPWFLSSVIDSEPFGLPMAGAINAISYTLWALWLVVLGVVVIRARAD